ncbi:uncharacterized protein [Gossypium hirsutum]|uniref:Ig-like domain-containing protein n=1 Tax=Gossypium hirsutum TaxID=3635 RepID=A0ABM3AWB7_GOSHI|nr:uncharacterized protein LOC107915683 [Gossypium hirsutum]
MTTEVGSAETSSSYSEAVVGVCRTFCSALLLSLQPLLLWIPILWAHLIICLVQWNVLLRAYSITGVCKKLVGFLGDFYSLPRSPFSYSTLFYPPNPKAPKHIKLKLPAKSPPSAPDSLSSWYLSSAPPSQISGPTVSVSLVSKTKKFSSNGSSAFNSTKCEAQKNWFCIDNMVANVYNWPITANSTDPRWKWFKNCSGALDGTHIKIRVSTVDKPRYRTQKGSSRCH